MAEQIEDGAALHLPLRGLEPVDTRPTVGPLLQGVVSAAHTAAPSSSPVPSRTRPSS
jgi:hypothetical protein